MACNAGIHPAANGWHGGHSSIPSISSAIASEAVPSETSASSLSEAPSSSVREIATTKPHAADRATPRGLEGRSEARTSSREVKGLQPVQEDQQPQREQKDYDSFHLEDLLHATTLSPPAQATSLPQSNQRTEAKAGIPVKATQGSPAEGNETDAVPRPGLSRSGNIFTRRPHPCSMSSQSQPFVYRAVRIA